MRLNLIAESLNKFEIYNGDTVVMKIKIDKRANAFRVNCNERKRVFFIEEGNAKSIIDAVINEYSQPLGFIQKLKDNKTSGFIETEGIKYIYSTSLQSAPEIKLYDNAQRTLILSCSLENFPLTNLTDNLQVKYILFALTWFMFVNAEKKETLELLEVLNR